MKNNIKHGLLFLGASIICHSVPIFMEYTDIR